MRLNNIFLSSLVLLACMACSTNTSELLQNSPISEETDSNEEPTPSEAAPEVYSFGDGNISTNGNSISNDFEGTTIQSQVEETIDNYNIYEQVYSNNYFHNAYTLNGDSVSGAIWTYAYRNKTAFGNEIQLDGTLSASPPSGLVSYNGHYFAAYPYRDDSEGGYQAYLLTPIHIEVNFATGTIDGFDYRRLDIINIDGFVDGNRIEGVIYGPDGTIEFEGGIFGDQGHELAAGFQNGGVAGFIYADFDEERTDLIN